MVKKNPDNNWKRKNTHQITWNMSIDYIFNIKTNIQYLKKVSTVNPFQRCEIFPFNSFCVLHCFHRMNILDAFLPTLSLFLGLYFHTTLLNNILRYWKIYQGCNYFCWILMYPYVIKMQTVCVIKGNHYYYYYY